MIDLHCHSHCSDGAFAPDVLLNKALGLGIKVLALTDHDTVDGLEPLHAAALNQNISIINGIELSVRWKKQDIHIIGLGIKPDDSNLQHVIARQNLSRIERAHLIAQQLEQCNVSQAYQKACKIAGHERVGRPHFAQVLVNEGKVTDIQSAFKRFLGRGRCAYVPTQWLTVVDAVEAIVASGGQAVIAHPLKYRLSQTKLCELIRDFKDSGGVGIEVVSGMMSAQHIGEMANLSLRFELLASTGSDYHNEQSVVGLGRQRSLPEKCMPIWHEWNVKHGTIICNTSR